MADGDNIFDLAEGRKLPLGTRRMWGRIPMIKTRDGWVPERESDRPDPDDPENDPRRRQRQTLFSRALDLAKKGKVTAAGLARHADRRLWQVGGDDQFTRARAFRSASQFAGLKGFRPEGRTASLDVLLGEAASLISERPST